MEASKTYALRLYYSRIYILCKKKKVIVMVDEKVDITNGDIKIMENLTWLMVILK